MGNKTAQDMTVDELRSYRPGQALERYENDPAVAARKERAWQVARAASDFLKTRYGAQRVIVFGSLARGKLFNPWSDIDLAVCGMLPAEYYAAFGAVMDIGLESGIKIDMVSMETSSMSFLSHIEQEGID